VSVKVAVGGGVAQWLRDVCMHHWPTEWQAPRPWSQLPQLHDCPRCDGWSRNIPSSFPRSSGVAQPATLCFSSSSTGQRWHQVPHLWWRCSPPDASLAQLCKEAVANGELSPLRSIVDLQRVVDDESVPSHPRACAASQLRRVSKETTLLHKDRDERKQEQERKRLMRAGFSWQLQVTLSHILSGNADLREYLDECEIRDQWAACDECGKWRRLRGLRSGSSKLGKSWTCKQNPDEAYAICSAPQELDDEEIDRLLGLAIDGASCEDCAADALDSEASAKLIARETPDRADANFQAITISLRGSALPACWANCDRCSKWRRLPVPLDESMQDQPWFCEMNTDLSYNRCFMSEESWDGEQTLQSSQPSRSSAWVNCDRCSKWRRLPVPLDESMQDQPWFCEMNANASYNRCFVSEESWDGEQTLEVKRNVSKQRSKTPRAKSQAASSSCDENLAISPVPVPLRPLLQAEKHVCVRSKFDFVFVNRVLSHHTYNGAAAGSLFNVYVRLAFSDGRNTGRSFVPSEPLLGSEALAAYLKTKDGTSMLRFVPERWRASLLLTASGDNNALHVQEGKRPVATSTRAVLAPVLTRPERQQQPTDYWEPRWPHPCGMCGRMLVAKEECRSAGLDFACGGDLQQACIERKREADVAAAQLPRAKRQCAGRR